MATPAAVIRAILISVFCLLTSCADRTDLDPTEALAAELARLESCTASEQGNLPG